MALSTTLWMWGFWCLVRSGSRWGYNRCTCRQNYNMRLLKNGHQNEGNSQNHFWKRKKTKTKQKNGKNEDGNEKKTMLNKWFLDLNSVCGCKILIKMMSPSKNSSGFGIVFPIRLENLRFTPFLEMTPKQKLSPWHETITETLPCGFGFVAQGWQRKRLVQFV